MCTESDELLSRPPPPAIIKGDSIERGGREADSPIVPRRFAITKKDFIDYGYTPACPGCYAAANDRKHKPHTLVCRNRISKALAEDETQAHRITDARERENAFLQNAVREAGMDRLIDWRSSTTGQSSRWSDSSDPHRASSDHLRTST